MQIDIQARHLSLTGSLRRYVERRLKFAMKRCDEHIQRLVIRLSDINGPRGGSDKQCHIQVVMAGMPDVVIEDTRTDIYAAIHRALDRAAQVVSRKINRRQKRHKHVVSRFLPVEMNS